MRDFCVHCGKEQPTKLWGAHCTCGNVCVHLEGCAECGKPIGYLIDDDYCAPERLICPDCIALARMKVQP